MKRIKLCDRQLPDYTRGEEIWNTVSHMVGGVFAIGALIACIAVPLLRGHIWGVVTGAIYGASLVLVYVVSSIYHALPKNMGKKVMQVVDHCMIYFLIGGTYTPVLLCSIRLVSPGWSWAIFGLVWGCAIMAAVFTAIDLKKYAVLSMICYIAMGWCIVIAIKPTVQALPPAALGWLLAGGISYTIGAIMYGLGRKRRYMHAVFHIFVVLGSVLQFICIIGYVL